MKQLHPKIKELRLKATPANYSTLVIDERGKLQNTSDEEGNYIEGYCCVWNVVDDRGTMWIKGAFTKSIRERGPSSQAKYKIVGCWQHDLKDPIGQVVELTEDDYGLRFKIKLDDFEAVPSAKRAFAQVNSGTINQFSFGFDYVWDKMEYNEAADAILMYEAELYEISPVTIASMEDTYAIRSVSDYESRKLMLDEETEDYIKSLPRSKQLEVRQLLTRHIALAKVEPLELRQKHSTEDKPQESVEGLNISELLNKIF